MRVIFKVIVHANDFVDYYDSGEHSLNLDPTYQHKMVVRIEIVVLL